MDLRKSQEGYRTIPMVQEFQREEVVEPLTWVATDLCTMLQMEVFLDTVHVQMRLHHEIQKPIILNNIKTPISKNNWPSVAMLQEMIRAISDSHFKEQFHIQRSVEMYEETFLLA